MAIKVYKKASANLFNVLSSYYESDIEAISATVEGSFNRFYCKCGYVGDQITTICPDCRTKKVKGLGEVSTYGTKSEKLAKTKKFDKKGDEVIVVSKKILKFSGLDNRSTLGAEVTEENMFELGKDYYNPSKNIDEWKLRSYNLNDYAYKEDIEKYKNILGDDKENVLTISTINNYFSLKKDCPKFLFDKDTLRYKNISKTIISDRGTKIPNKSFKDFLNTEFAIPDEYIASVDDDIVEAAIHYNFGLRLLSSYSYKTYTEAINSFLVSKSSHKDLILHYFESGLISLSTAYIIFSQLKYFEKGITGEEYSVFDYKVRSLLTEDSSSEYTFLERIKQFKKYEEFLDAYIKENIQACDEKENIISLFLVEIDQLNDMGIEIKESNFKLKNINLMKNQLSMAEEYGIEQDKVDFFLETFEVNPLQAISLVKDRRKLTKKQKEDFLDLMIKEA